MALDIPDAPTRHVQEHDREQHERKAEFVGLVAEYAARDQRARPAAAEFQEMEGPLRDARAAICGAALIKRVGADGQQADRQVPGCDPELWVHPSSYRMAGRLEPLKELIEPATRGIWP